MNDRLLTATEVGGLVDLRGFDLWRRLSVDASHTSMDRTAANEAHDFNDVADLRKVLAAVLVEPVNGVRGIPRDERHGIGPHLRTMAGRR